MAEWKEPKTTYKATDQVTPSIFNTLGANEIFLNETKITTEQVQQATVNSTENGERVNLAAAETITAAFGKIRKWFTDLKSLAFKTQVEAADIASAAVTMGKIESHAVSYGKIATGAVRTDKLQDLAVTTIKIADGAVTNEKIASVAASKVTGLATVATSGSYNDLSDKPYIGSGFTLEKVTFQFNKQYNIPATGIYLCYLKYTNSSGSRCVACLGTMSNSPNVQNGTYSGISSINFDGTIKQVQIFCETVSTTALKYHLRVSSSATTFPSADYSGGGTTELIMYKLGSYGAVW